MTSPVPHEYPVAIGSIEFTVRTRRDLFSPRRLDAGTRAMLQCVEFDPEDRVLDLGCGCGPVAVYVALLLSPQQVVAVDVSSEAVQCTQKNAERAGVQDIVVVRSDGFRDCAETGFTKILCNPPYHSDFAVAKHFILKGFNRLQLGGEMYFVTKRDKWYCNKLRSVFGGVRTIEKDGYFVISAQKRSETYARSRR